MKVLTEWNGEYCLYRIRKVSEMTLSHLDFLNKWNKLEDSVFLNRSTETLKMQNYKPSQINLQFPLILILKYSNTIFSSGARFSEGLGLCVNLLLVKWMTNRSCKFALRKGEKWLGRKDITPCPRTSAGWCVFYVTWKKQLHSCCICMPAYTCGSWIGPNNELVNPQLHL